MRFFALLLVLPTLVLQAATTTSAGAAIVAGFEIDGNTPDGPEAGIDWASPGVPAATADPVGNVDTTTFKGSKEFEHPSTWVRGVGLAPNQDDVSAVYHHSALVGADTWSYVAFRRFTTSGTTNYDLEFNQLKNSTTSTFQPIRSVDDLMVRFEQDGNSTFKLTLAYRWTRLTSASWGAGCIEVPGYTPRSGWCSVSVAGSGFVGVTGEDGHFAEGAFNLSAFFGGGGTTTTCRGSFGTLNLRSFTGNSDESALKDYISPVDINIAGTCGKLEIRKFDQFGTEAAGATFSISPNPIPGQSASPLVIVDGGAGDPDGLADGSININPATPGTYTITETAPPPGSFLPLPNPKPSVEVIVGQNGVGSTGPAVFVNKRTFQPPTVVNVPTYDIDYNWLVTKSVADPTTVNVPQGTDATFDYQVRLKALDPTTSGFGGTVTLTNPNSLGMVVTLASEITGGAACTVVGAGALDVSGAPGLQVDLDPGATEFAYTCPAATLPGGTTATATWDEAVYPQPPGPPAPTYTRSDAKAFAIDQATDETTTVTDTFGAGPAEDFGTFDWNTVRASNDPAPNTVVVKSYSRDIPGVPGKCTAYDNTAHESADGTHDSESVTVCVGVDLDVTKTADLGYQRELLWDIDKSGPGTVFTGADDQGDLQRLVRFTIDITADGMTDSDWALTGAIAIDNPNEWAVTGTISDTVVVDGKTLTCDVLTPDVSGAAGHQVTIPANSVDHPFSYECDGVTQGAYVGNNTVKFDYSADSHEYPDADDTDSHTQAVTVTGDQTPTNATVTISDLLDGTDVTGDLPQTEFVWTSVNAMEGSTQSIDYDVVLSTEADACTPYENVVTIDQTEQSDDHTVTVCSPGVAKTVVADYGRKRLWELDKEVDRTDVEISQGGSATFNYTVTATPLGVVDDGTSSWTGEVSVHNPSPEVPLTVDVTDLPDVAGWTCEFTEDVTGVVIAGGATETFAYACQGEGHPSGTNTATASFDKDQSVSTTVDVDFDARPQIADSIVPVYDDKTNPGAKPVLLGQADAADGPTEFTYSLVKEGTAGACTTYDNTAVLVLEATDPDPIAEARATLCVEKPLTVDVTAQGSYGVTYPWSIEKDVNRTRVEVDAETGEATFDYTVTVRAGKAASSDWTMNGEIAVANPNTYQGGAITLTGASVITDVGGGADCTATLPQSPVVPVGSGQTPGTLTVPFSCTFTGDPSTSGTVQAAVTWDPAGPAESASAGDTGPVQLSIGRETNKTVDVVDDKTDPQNPVLLEEDLTWSEGLVKEYEYALTLPGTAGTCVDYTNTAMVDLDEGRDPSAQETVTVCVEKPLEAEVSATGSLARAYAWSVEKAADATTRTVGADGTATFRYTVTARAGAMTESGWVMGGQVTVSNPNAYEGGSITADVAVTSDLGGGVSCTVTGGEDLLLPAVDEGEDGTVTLPFTCTFASQPAGSGTVTATVTWDPPGEDSSASTADSSPVALTVASETNKTVAVVDDKTVPGQRIVLDPAVTWSTGLAKSYTYDLAVAGGAAGACASHTNTATVDQPVGTDPTATATVTACTPEVLPEEAFGKAGGSVKASCQGTVRSKLNNRSGASVTYQLRVGKKVHRIVVKSLGDKKFTTTGKALAKVVLKAEGRTLDRLRIPQRCVAPEVLPDTGLRAGAARLAVITRRWRF